MITTCTVCQARYQLEDDKVPRRVIRVRCPACSGVFSLDGSKRAEAAAAPAPERLQGLETGFAAAPPPVAPASRPAPSPCAPPLPRRPRRRSPAPRPPGPPPLPRGPWLWPSPRPPPAAPRAAAAPRKRCWRARWCRTSWSTTATQRDAALRDGNLLEALGAEIKKSWELYKEKVTPEVANSTNHFREALNEILAEGEKVF